MFLEHLMPSRGLYCVALLVPKYGTFRHFFHETLGSAVNRIEALDRSGHNVYLAQATFDTDKIRAAQAQNAEARTKEERAKERSQGNAVYLKNFFLDIDCGEKWPLKSQKEGCQALKLFIDDTGLPMPTVINSGNGLYAHWVLSNEVPAHQWQMVAKVLKQVVAAYSPKIGGDSSRTSDSASVLRPLGTTNRKPGRAEKPVTMIYHGNDVKFVEFASLLGAAARKRKIDRTALLPPKASSDINDEFLVRQESIPSDPELVASKCSQLAHMRDTQGNISEPLWYCCIGLLSFCEEGEATAHEWSSGHPDYSYGQTENKLQQWSDSGMGPTTCSKFGEVNPDGCIGCPHINKIKSPIVLGRPEPKAIQVEENGEVQPPAGYRRAEDGLFVNIDDRWVKFYDQDLFVHQLAYDESLGYEVMVIRHSLPYEGGMEFALRSSIVNDSRAFMIGMADNHVKVVGTQEKKFMLNYVEGYAQVIQRQRKMIRLLCSMGWKEDNNGPMFVLGKKIFHANGTVDDASLAKNVPSAINGFRSAGTLEGWKKMTTILNKPGLQPFAFAFLAGAFGAPLMKFTGFEGAVVSMWGDSGAGKTLLLRMIHSVWGYHRDLIMLRDDTKNVVMSRLGMYSNLPLTIDEITNIQGMEGSDLLYRITQGRDKNRLTRTSEEKQNVNKWNTLAVTTSNASLVDLLSSMKQDASAELNRVLEYHVQEHPEFKGKATTETYWALDENYGLAGEVYAQWLVQNVDKIRPALDKVRDHITKEAGLRGDERYWGAIASVGLVGGMFAKQLGLINFEISPIFKWVVNRISEMRLCKNETTGRAVDVLGQFLSAHTANRLVVIKTGLANKVQILDEPRGALIIRVEMHTQALFISQAQVRSWISKSYGSYTKMRKDLIDLGVLVHASASKNLGAGTNFVSAAQPCWKIDLTNKHLGTLGDDLQSCVATIADNEDALF